MEEVFGAVGKKCTPWSSHFGAKQLPSLAPDLARGTEPQTGAWDPKGSSWMLLWGCQAGDPTAPCASAPRCMGAEGLWGAQRSHRCSPLIIPSF